MIRDAETRRRGDAEKELAFHRRVSASPCLRVSPFGQPVFVWAVVATVVLGFVSLVMVAPVAHAQGHTLSAFFLYELFGRVCHQIPERAFELAGHPLAVCARCTGIYFGFAAVVVVYPLVRSLKRTDAPARKWLLAAAAPTLLDFALGFFGVWENTHWSRALTGALLGGVAALYVVPGLVDLGYMICERRPKVSGRAG